MTIAVVTLVFALSATPLAAREVRVPDGTHVPLKLMQFISSETNRPGDPVQLQVARDVAVRGTVVIRRGTPASGTITEAKPYRSRWWVWRVRVHPGRLAFKVTETTSSNGDSIRLRLTDEPWRRVATAPLIRWEHEGEMFDAVVEGDYIVTVPVDP